MKPAGNIEQNVIACAHRLFIEKGYVNTSMSDIAAAVGITRPALHYYFRTKERLFRAIYGDILQEVIPRIHDILIRDIPFMERLDRIIDEYVALFLNNPDLPYFMIGEIQRDVNHLIEAARELKIDKYILDIQNALKTAMREGILRPVPSRIVFLTLYSQLTFPFLMKNLVTTLLLEDKEQFSVFIREWKRNVLSQMACLLCPHDENGDV